MQDDIREAISMIQARGFQVKLGRSIGVSDDQFAGSDELRANDLKNFLEDQDIEAILLARGGYGTMRTLNQLSEDVWQSHHKLIIGYSDVTVLHGWLNTRLGTPSLHATMPVSFTTHSAASVETLLDSLLGKLPEYRIPAHLKNRDGLAKGVITGGNLSILYSMLGTRWDWDASGMILLLEDVDEYLYHIDRMMVALYSAGKLERLAGVIVGGMTDMHDNAIPFGMDATSIIASWLPENIPVCMGFPAGHQSDNLAVPFGIEATLEVNSSGGHLYYS
ncbi:MAG: LD-carboxypeptidase [Chitinophagales bacterium]|nr:LD-carboxypeptidase [Chitinophagales bacterium]MCB9019026.1 LD-carboxypeptidase [Chitinophagales bacterium]MCB9022429.1 LD-carboxypeptidase [Chitinophagales bacterium]HAE13573.1 LD-carboxypeptidase [Bacteroidota bacterium]HAE34371.1 LD-carboxypeptidase [Bacteroidota bacterium]